MTDFSSPVRQAQQQVRQATRKASPFVEKFARIGYAAKGAVYVLVGALAAMAAIGSGRGRTTGSDGAMQTLLGQPFGQVLLGIVAFGLAGYSLWQFIRAIEDPEGEGSDGKAILKRIGFFASGVIHLVLVFAAVQLLIGSGSGGGGGGDDAGAKSWTATVMSYPLGRLLVGLAGACVVGYGAQEIFRAWKSKVGERLMLGELSDGARRWIIRITRFGMASRGVVFGLIGLFLVIAAWQHDASEARGVAGALQTLERQPYGPWLLGVVALGLVAYGIYMLVQSRYRRITPG